MIPLFSVARLPRIEFGSGAFRKLPSLLAAYGKRHLIVTGNRSLRAVPHWAWLSACLKKQGFSRTELTVATDDAETVGQQHPGGSGHRWR